MVVRGQDRTSRKQVQITGTVRDFRERMANGGHPDFERTPDGGFHLYAGNVAPSLSDDGKPVYTGRGYEVTEQWTDSSSRPISSQVAMAHPEEGDVAGKTGEPDDGGVQSVKTFDLWFRDSPGINAALRTALTFAEQANGTWVFDDRLDPEYKDLGGCFPLEGLAFGSSGGTPDRNFHFTLELHGEFVYDAYAGQFIEVSADDDLWVFINGELVIDLGGVHWVKTQVIGLDRLGLGNGKICRFDLFYAERHREESRLRIATNIKRLGTVQAGSGSAPNARPSR